MQGLLGKKVGMTQVFTEKGDCVCVTVVQVEGCVPVLKRTQEKDGYEALVVAYGQTQSQAYQQTDAGSLQSVENRPRSIAGGVQGDGSQR